MGAPLGGGDQLVESVGAQKLHAADIEDEVRVASVDQGGELVSVGEIDLAGDIDDGADLIETSDVQLQ